MPIGIELMGEGTLIEMAYAYEMQTPEKFRKITSDAIEKVKVCRRLTTRLK